MSEKKNYLQYLCPCTHSVYMDMYRSYPKRNKQNKEFSQTPPIIHEAYKHTDNKGRLTLRR